MIRLWMSVTGAVALLCIGANASAAQRAFSVEDVFRTDEVAAEPGGSIVTSPDGKDVVFGWTRPESSQTNFGFSSPWLVANRDVWLQMGHAAPINLTRGDVDGTGWLGAVWSPNGKRLALLGSRDGKRAVWSMEGSLLWVWDRKDGRLRQVSHDLVRRYSPRGKAITWTDDSHVLVVLNAEQPQTRWQPLPEVQLKVIDAWQKTLAGRESTASALDSGVPEDLAKRPRERLALVDVDTGKMVVLADGNGPDRVLSPDHRLIAYAKWERHFTPAPAKPLSTAYHDGVFSLQVVDLSGRVLVTSKQTDSRLVLGSIRWSPDSRGVVFARYLDDAGEAIELVRADASSGKVETVGLGHLKVDSGAEKPPQMLWGPAGELLVAAMLPGDDAAKARRNWWSVRADGTQSCLTCSLESAPDMIWPVADSEGFVGVAGGALIRIQADGTTRTLASDVGKIDRLVWPAELDYYKPVEGLIPEHRYSKVVVATAGASGDLYTVVDVQSGASTKLEKPDEGAQFAAYHEDTGAVAFTQTGQGGTSLWHTPSRAEPLQRLRHTNSFLSEVAGSRNQLITYRSLNGHELKAWLMLPADYQPGRRYPTVVWVYNGSVVSPTAKKPSSTHLLGSDSYLNMQIPVGRGFAVLIPSMPLDEASAADDPLLRLTDGVLPAIDKGVELGIVDNDRLFVMGQSFGGYSTYGLVALTERFKGAAALAGAADLFSFYGSIPIPYRYLDTANDMLGYFMFWSETGQGHLGNPPWKDLGRYLRNSPITYVDRINTPLLMIQGDMDIGPINDSENVFRSLLRQGKRAELVRYWGEGHVLCSPANVRDMWTRILNWFDENGHVTRDAQGNMVFDGQTVRAKADMTR